VVFASAAKPEIAVLELRSRRLEGREALSLPRLVLFLVLAAASGYAHAAEEWESAADAAWGAPPRALSIADEDLTVSQYSNEAYAHLYGAPAATQVPLVIGFRTRALATYETSVALAKLKVTAASGLDFSAFQVSHILDLMNLPNIAYVEATATELQLFFEQGSFQAETSYEATLLVLTGSEGVTLGSITLSWYAWQSSSGTWVQQERSVQNSGGYRPDPDLDAHLIGATLHTSTSSMSGSAIVKTWASRISVLTVLLDIFVDSTVTGVISIMLGPASAWVLGGPGGGIDDGAACPDSSIGGVEGHTMGVRYPSSVTNCYLRRRGGRVNSIDLSLIGTDLSGGILVKLYLPVPLAGDFDPWYLAYRESGASPGYLVMPLPIQHSSLIRYLGPKPSASITGLATEHPGLTSEVSLTYQTGATLRYVPNSRVDFFINSTVFTLEPGGCRLGASSPYRAEVVTSLLSNACTVTWGAQRTAGIGTVQVGSTGEVTGTGVDFHALSIAGEDDSETVDGSSFSYLTAGSERYIVKTRKAASIGTNAAQVLAAASNNLVGSGTKFSSGSFTETLLVGDYVVIRGRTFVVTAVTDDTTCDVTESGSDPVTAVATAAYSVTWKSRLMVAGFLGETSGLTTVAAGTSFYIEVAKFGVAFWNQSYTLSMHGRNTGSNQSLSTLPSIRVSSGRDDGGDGKVDFWSAAFDGSAYSVQSPPVLWAATLHPSTVAAGAKARMVLSFTTPQSTRYSGQANDNLRAGMVLRVFTAHSDKLKLLQADGKSFETDTTEADGLDCSSWLLEVWGEDSNEFPQPGHCWWDAWASFQPSVYVRFAVGNGLRGMQSYEFVFLAILEKTANAVPDLVGLEIVDGDGITYMGFGNAGITKTLVTQSTVGEPNQPVLSSLEMLVAEPIADGKLQFRIKSRPSANNQITAGNVVRLFLFPLTAWNVGSKCEAARSDGGVVACATEYTGRNANVLAMTLDQNSLAIGGDSSIVFTITGLSMPLGGLFREPFAVEVWAHPRETPDYWATYIGSADGRLGGMNFASVPVGRGYGSVVAHNVSSTFGRNTVVIVFRPAATCRSTAAMPCRLTVTAPDGFEVVSAGAPAAASTAYTPVPLIAAAPTCDRAARACKLDVVAGSALWAGGRYGLSMVVDNPSWPLAKGSADNVWMVAQSGANGWDFGIRQTAASLTLSPATSFAVQAGLVGALVQPDLLQCGASVQLRVQFVASQRVPVGGKVTITAPSSLLWLTNGSAGCYARPVANFPSDATCTVVGQVATLSLGQALAGGSSFHAFDLRASLASAATTAAAAAAGMGVFTISTSSATSPLDAVATVTWSAQLDAAGSLVFSEALGCWEQGLWLAELELDNRLPYEVTEAAATAQVRFQFDDLDILDNDVNVIVYAPAGFDWELGANLSGFSASGGGTGTSAVPLVASPVVAAANGANVLRLLSTGPLLQKTLYGFSAKIRVPKALPGTAANSAGGPFWYLAFGSGSGTVGRKAAGRLVSAQLLVRALADFQLSRSTSVPSAVGAMALTFTTATALPKAGRLLLELPSGFAFGSYLGQNCTSDPGRAGTSDGDEEISLLPSDASLACIQLRSSGPLAFEWTIGASGLPAGRYSVAVFVKNPSAFASRRLAMAGEHILKTFLDAARAVMADAPASALAADVAVTMLQAQLVRELVAGTGLTDFRPGRQTWVVFAFELAEDIEPDFDIVVHAPAGFEVPSICDAHIGDGKVYSPVGSTATSLASHITQYILFPSGTSISCAGSGSVATISISPVVGGSRSTFPAVSGKMYLFRLSVTNPLSTPDVNEWSLRVDDEEFNGIRGFDLWAFRDTSVRTSNTAAGEVGVATVRFWSRTEVPGLYGARHGVIVVSMPVGFELQTNAAGACKGFSEGRGLRNSTGPVGALVTCERVSLWPSVLVLHNNLPGPLTLDMFEFEVEVRNPTLPTAALPWDLASFSSMPKTKDGMVPGDLLTNALMLDYAQISGFAANEKLLTFGVAPWPAGQQNSGTAVALRFALELSRGVQTGDAFIVRGPAEYRFQCDETGFQSQLLPRPVCSGSQAAFSFAEVNSSLLPVLVPVGSEHATILTFELGAVNPMTKPLRNSLEFVHCRGVGNNDTELLLGDDLCPKGAYVVASVQKDLWPIVPMIKDVQIGLLDQKVAAANQSSNVQLRFLLMSTGATKVRVRCFGMDFSACGAQLQGSEVRCSGTKDSAELTATGVQLPAGAGAGLIDLKIRSVKNPATAGPTSWGITTHGPDASGAEVVYDESEAHVGHRILEFAGLEPVKHCAPQYLLGPHVERNWYRSCSSRQPWYQQSGNKVVFRFLGFHRGEVMRGHQLLVQPPKGFSFPLSGAARQLASEPAAGLGSSEELAYKLAQVGTLPLDDPIPVLESTVLLINLTSYEPLASRFSIELTVNNPGVDPKVNLWRAMLLAPNLVPIYTNDGNWPGFELRGTFLQAGRTFLKSLVTSFPSETNVVRVTLALASDLSGANLQMKIVAPAGFIFESDCMPKNPDLLPTPSLTTAAWLSTCSGDVRVRNQARLNIPNVGTGGGFLSGGMTYATNLKITNAETFNESSTPMWELYTFRNNDNTRFMHFTTLESFPLDVLWAQVVPEVPKFSSSSQLLVSVQPMRDLGPHGQLIINAPTAFVLFCRLSPFFIKGNLPAGASCSGANNFAIVQLAGSDFLERGVVYQFSLRVTNPAQMKDAAAQWSIRLQTQERELVHETSQVASYALAPRAISRFAVAPVSAKMDLATWLRVQFKLETVLARASANLIQLHAPEGFRYSCANSQARNGFVLPSEAVLAGNLDQFTDLSLVLEPPAARGLEAYRNDGTTEDGRAMVDCAQPGVLGLVVDYTDLLTLGRYAFRVQVMNPSETPDLNVWTLQSYSDSQLIEQGATRGYEIVVSASPVVDGLLAPQQQLPLLVSKATHSSLRSVLWVVASAAILS